MIKADVIVDVRQIEELSSHVQQIGYCVQSDFFALVDLSEHIHLSREGKYNMVLTAVASDDEREGQGKLASQSDNLPVVWSDWRKRGGADRLATNSAAAVTEALIHNSGLLFRSVGSELARIDDLAEQITSTRPGLAYHLAGFEDMLVQAWKCRMAQYLNCGRP